jgi:Glycosyl hydrolases family 2, sugar binding domain
MSRRMVLRWVVPAILLGTLIQAGIAEDRRLLLDLRGSWKFELGDDMRRSEPNFNDSRWSSIKVPSPWEDQGYPGYDGYAWYRRSFTSPKEWLNKQLYLRVGRIDDVDEVYVNGQLVGFRGVFPPHYLTMYMMQREYPLPTYLLKPNGENVIAVRVFDSELGGGIVDGAVGIFEEVDRLVTDFALEGTWRLTKGYDPAWQNPAFDDSRWPSVKVPAYWDSQGLQEYDGYGCYRLHFRVPPEATSRNLVLLLGKIDDLDETYLNGERIGGTGSPDGWKLGRDGDEYNRLRAYTVRGDLLRGGSENVLVVKVFDRKWHGGIYDGPIGFTTPEKYRTWSKQQKKGAKNWIDRLMQKAFE